MTVLRIAALIVVVLVAWAGLGALVVFILFGQPRRQQKGPDMNAFEKSLKWCDPPFQESPIGYGYCNTRMRVGSNPLLTSMLTCSASHWA